MNKNSKCCFEHILDAAPYKMAAVQPLVSHLTNYPRKNKLTSDILYFGQPAKTCIRFVQTLDTV